MNLAEAFRIALRALRANGLRSALTTLGVIIGVSAVVVLVALGKGVQSGFNESFGVFGTQLRVTKSEGGVPGGKAKELTDSDVTALGNRTRAPDVSSATPVLNGTAPLEAGTGQFRVSVAGSTAEYLVVNNRDVLVGQFFTEAQERANAKVVVLGPDSAANLFGGDAGAALGQEVRIGRAKFKVIGVVARNGQQDDLAIMPLGAMRAYLLGGSDRVDEIVVQAASVAQVPSALDQVNTVLSERHRIKGPAKRDFDAAALQEQVDQINQFLTFLTLFTVAVAAISLVVGGIGVANIMLVSVTERTREIGIRRAIGAPRSAILKQFLIEACVLAGMGGVVGILVGVGITLAGAEILPTAIPNFPAPQISVDSIAVAFAISLAIGLLAGGYPAHRAARLRPIEALRYQ
jgi:putative ABC transport system permease protein